MEGREEGVGSRRIELQRSGRKWIEKNKIDHKQQYIKVDFYRNMRVNKKKGGFKLKRY